ncbi:MAG: DUF4388 domain-containing protein [Candidatus Methylomirabilales bacterium]
MAFTGRLDGLAIADILQILGLMKKTGKLTLTRLGSSGVILFRNGEVVFATSDSVRTLLGTTLVKERSLTETALRAALELQHVSPHWKRLGGILVEKGLISPAALSEAMQHQLEQVLLEFLTWETGYFRFESMEIASEDDVIQAGKDPQHFLHGELFKKMFGEDTWGEVLQGVERELEGLFVEKRSAEGGK